MIHGRSIHKLVCGLAAGALLVAAACSDDDDDGGDGGGGDGQEESGGTLAEVKQNETLRCGVNNEVPGFGFQQEGEYAGFDIDYCKAIAAAVLDDPEAVEYIPTTPEERLSALAGGEYDVLIRNTTFTSTRDGKDGVTFAHPNFYDGQGMMVRTDAGIDSIDQLEGKTICFTRGTTTEQNLADRMAGINYTPEAREENPEVQQAFIEGQCDGWTSDRSQLAALRSNWPADAGGPEALKVLDEVFSKEPLAPAVRDGDTEWYEIVNWVVLGTIEAEELGVTSENVEEMKSSDDPRILRLLGQAHEQEEGGTAVTENGFGVDDEFMVRVIEAVGNYGEIFDRNVGPGTPLGLERGDNALHTEGGLQYSPPFR